MADGFIVRKGGVAEEVLRTTNPSINFVSKTQTQIVVTFTNNDAAEAEIYYGLTAPLTDTVTLATATTSSNVTFSGLDADTQYTVSAYAIVTNATLKKIKSEIISTQITTDALVYTAATGGTTEEYDDGGTRYKSHTFTSDGTFTVTTVGDADGDRNKVDYLIIAGGGSGGNVIGGGGGAGGYRTTVGTQGGNGTLGDKVVVTAQAYSIHVGSGGTGLTGDNQGNSGTNSVALGITSASGGGGGSGDQDNANRNGVNGGSGGGAVYTGGKGGTGTANQGTNGGNGSGINTAAGGGGSNNAGQNAQSSSGGNGGNGLANLLRTGSNETRAGGGGGGARSGSGRVGGTGGTGGASSGTNDSSTPSNATVNTGSGGGGSGFSGTDVAGSNGGSGIVVIRYEIAPSV